ncbi:MAG: hypothetical protein PHW25_04060 [Zoogloea sp.]|uniref:hypothetical protein n=1 Tax=Zoogloea sp. TaxID=49181 RepID=UPI0026111584|nr:hypothetical protein [Zoogloea sp.]MDD3326243.1 hypothetical protein [Zoogloea sp.]
MQNHTAKNPANMPQKNLSNCFVDKFYTKTRIVKFITFFFVMNNPAKQLIVFIFLTNKWILLIFGISLALSPGSSTCTQATTTEEKESS